uniref:Putative double-stranded RNA-binding protein 4 isoform X3 n=1 Tax=Davidia involucrata TaxID=16924 RepID=A0A5B7BGK9_DAVIN
MAPSQSNASLPDHMMHKNKLQEYTQKLGLQLPIYQTINEGFPHAPKFRSTVLVDGAKYTSMLTFSHRKEAEQDVAKQACECLTKKIKNEECLLIHQDPLLCKSILHEFAVKMNLDIPTYTTNHAEEPHPIFVSSLVFYAKTYTGDVAGSKKVAQQLAARTAIQSLLGSESGTVLSQIIKSKGKFYASEKDSCFSQRILTAAVQPEDSSRGLTNNLPSIGNFNSEGTIVDPCCGRKRRLELKYQEEKKMRSHGE